jgi:lytic murein transglycosylase
MAFRRSKVSLLALWLAGAVAAGPAMAACGDSAAGFATWLEGFKQEAVSLGISPAAVSAGLAGVTYDPAVIKADHSQHVFKQSFEQFSGRMIPPRLKRARGMLNTYGPQLAVIEKQYGVPGAVVVAIWGLETDFGAVRGKMATIRSLATLAYDCRRSDFFRGQLVDALRIVERGDLSPSQMRGGWAGELGQTQFLPSSYVAFAVDFDGDGRRNLLTSPTDVLASTAKYLAGHGWQRGQPWTEGTANFSVLLTWNKAMVYTKTVAEFARRLSEG